MSLRSLFLSGVLASGLILTSVPRADADPPWAGARGYSTRADRDHDKADHRYWRHRNGNRDYNYNRSYERNGPPYHRNHRSYRNDPEYAKLVDRINHDRAKIAEIAPTGRHRKALQWYRDDLRNAQRDMRNYRGRRSSNDYDSRDRYYESNYDTADSESFDWSNLLGSLINPAQ